MNGWLDGRWIDVPRGNQMNEQMERREWLVHRWLAGATRWQVAMPQLPPARRLHHLLLN